MQNPKGASLINISLTFLLFLGIFSGLEAQANDPIIEEMNEEYHRVSSIEVVTVETDLLNQETHLLIDESLMHTEATLGANDKMSFSPANVGQVIWIAQGLVALGEGVYNLVQKGKPANTTNYAPISVMPKEGRNYVEILETENWNAPQKRTFMINIKNGFGMEVVKFRYSVIYSHGGSFNGAGAYITAAQIIPEYVLTSFGFDFSASMRLNGIQNHGTKANPVAGAILTMEYKIESFVSSLLRSDSFHITGRGGFKRF